MNRGKVGCVVLGLFLAGAGCTQSTTDPSATLESTSTATASTEVVPLSTSSSSTTVTSTTTTTSAPTTTASTSTTTTTLLSIPDMECSWGPDVLPEDCFYWGFVKTVDTSAPAMVFDLVRYESTGSEDYEYEMINQNTLLRTLDISDDLVVLSCPPEDGATIPGECNSPMYFEAFGLTELAEWVPDGYEFWGLTIVNDEVTGIEQWWAP